MSEEKWGFGKGSKFRDGKPFDHTWLGEQRQEKLDVLFGEYPHSRNDNNIYARTQSGTIYEFDGHRVLIDISFKSYNYLKESGLSGDQIRRGGQCLITADNDPIYSFFFRNIERALLRAHYLITELSEHSSGIITKDGRQTLVGRKIYYDRIPAIIKRFIGDQGAIIIEPESGHKFLPPVYDPDDDESRDSIKADILSHHIWWHRD